MSERPEVSVLTEDLYQSLGWHTEQDEAYDWALLKFCAAWVETLIDPVYELAREGDDGEPPWISLFDPEKCPADALPYLAQFVGCVLTPEMDESQRRAEITAPSGWKRGREDTLRIVAARNLTGTKRLYIRPRTPEPGMHYIRVLSEECADPVRTEATIRAALPAWEALNFAAIDAVTWEDVEAGWESWEELEADFDTWEDLEDLLPTELPP